MPACRQVAATPDSSLCCPLEAYLLEVVREQRIVRGAAYAEGKVDRAHAAGVGGRVPGVTL
jgi:hypothetical protein